MGEDKKYGENLCKEERITNDRVPTQQWPNCDNIEQRITRDFDTTCKGPNGSIHCVPGIYLHVIKTCLQSDNCLQELLNHVL